MESTTLNDTTTNEQSPNDLVFKHKTIKDGITEIERFIKFLNNRFNLKIQDDLIVLISETRHNTLGIFNQNWKEQKEDNKINSITISSQILKGLKPYETIAHELAHYLDIAIDKSNFPRGNYHTQKFKVRAEQLLLKVIKGTYGYNITEETNEFNEMLKEFKPDENAFKVFQEPKGIKGKPSQTRNLKFICDCGFIMRSAKNKDKPIIAICGYCKGMFKEVLKNE